MMQPRTTSVPNVFFDVHLKELKQAELKVLLVVTRQTNGWKDERGVHGRKEIDWISGSQLQQKTGCSRRAISDAIAVLVRKKLIVILNENGFALNTPEKRRGKYKLYYRLSATVDKPVENPVDINPTNAKFAEELRKKVIEVMQKMHITKETLQNQFLQNY